MNEARDRKIQQFSSSIFSGNQQRSATPQPVKSTYDSGSSRRQNPASENRTPTNRPLVKETASFTSTVFAPPEQPQLKYNPHKPMDHYDGDFYAVERRLGNGKQREIVPEFQPSYKYEQQPRLRDSRRKNAEMVARYQEGKVMGENEGKETTLHVLQETNAKVERKAGLDEVAYRTSFKWTDSRSEMPKRNQRPVTPEQRRKKESESSVFGPRESSDNGEKKTRVEAERPSERNYSDLFGREFPHPKSTAQIKESTPSSANWKDARYESKPRGAGEDYSPSQFRDQQLRSSFDPHQSTALSVSTTPKEAYSPTFPSNPKQMKQFNLNQFDVGDIPKPEEAKLDTFVIKGLKPTDDVQAVKQLCQGLHIVSVETEVDDIKGSCTGQAKVTLRHFPGTGTVEKLQVSVAEAGLEITPHQPDIKKRNNYTELAGKTFLDHQIQQEEKRLGGEVLDAKVNKMKSLESSADLYGSSPGVGRWPAEWKKKQSRVEEDFTEDQNTRAQLHAWEGVKKNRSQTPNAMNSVSPNSSFLRPTESFKNRTKGVA